MEEGSFTKTGHSLIIGRTSSFSYNKQYAHSIYMYITGISINIIQKGSRRKSTDLSESVSLYLQ